MNIPLVATLGAGLALATSAAVLLPVGVASSQGEAAVSQNAPVGLTLPREKVTMKSALRVDLSATSPRSPFTRGLPTGRPSGT